jgi:type IV secretion system protein VirB8
MTETAREKLDEYYANAGSWADERTQSIYASRKVAWIVAFIAATIAVLEALAIVFMMPLKTVVPQTILVDKQTGFVQTLDPANPQKIEPQKALTQSYLVQYVEAREGFDIATVQGQFKKVALWSSGGAKTAYVNMMQATNPESPLARLPRNSLIDVKVRSVSQLSDNSALVRFAAARRDPGAAEQPAQNWVAVVRYQYSNAPMTVEDRYANPLGFQVVDYRKDAESLPTETVASTATPPVQPMRKSMSAPATTANTQPSLGMTTR